MMPLKARLDFKKFFAALDHSDTLSNRIEQTGKWLLQLLNKYERQERKKDWVIEESELLDKEEYLKAYKRLQEEQRFRSCNSHFPVCSIRLDSVSE